MDVVALLTYYRFEADIPAAERLVAAWRQQYPAAWLRPAVLQALYQGRYKSISVSHILQLWRKQGQPHYQFSGEFERLIGHTPAPRRRPAGRVPPTASPVPIAQFVPRQINANHQTSRLRSLAVREADS